jgi:hypothetical protein
MGFSIEGRRAQCLFVDGRFIDELYMAALLPGPNPADPPGTPGQRTVLLPIKTVATLHKAS